MGKSLTCSWDKEPGAMDGCYKLYTWINDTILMLLLQILWKMSQISDYFKERSEAGGSRAAAAPTPLTAAHKHRRHIRSMSDVQASTPWQPRARRLSAASYTCEDLRLRNTRINYCF